MAGALLLSGRASVGVGAAAAAAWAVLEVNAFSAAGDERLAVSVDVNEGLDSVGESAG